MYNNIWLIVQIQGWNTVGSSGRVIWVKLATCFVHVKWVWSRFCIRSRALIMVSGPDQSNELGMLDNIDAIVSPDLLYHMWLHLRKLGISAQITHVQKMVLFLIYAYNIYIL